MFGHRPDGNVLKKVDPMITLTPYIMPMRCDAQVFLDYKVDYEKLVRYIVSKKEDGIHVSFLEIVIAAYVRTIAEVPEVNRFISNKRIYARNNLSVSFTVLQNMGDPDQLTENTLKCYFDPHETIFEVAKRIGEAIEYGTKPEADNSIMKMLKALLKPAITNIGVYLFRFLDRYGIIPKAVTDLSPFHSSMFITQMASIGMPNVKHHIYNFGTTSLFLSIGAVQRVIENVQDGKAVRKRYLPIGITADERICAGAQYAKMLNTMMKYINDPVLLETPPQKVRYEEGHEIKLPKKTFY